MLQNVTLPVKGLNFQYNKTGSIPGSDSIKKKSLRVIVVVASFREDNMIPNFFFFSFLTTKSCALSFKKVH